MPDQAEPHSGRMRRRNCCKIRKPLDERYRGCGNTAWLYDPPKDQTMPGMAMKEATLGWRVPGGYGSGKRK